MTLLLDGEARLEVADNVLSASGEAGFDAATALATAGCDWLDQQAEGSRVAFDLSRVGQASSAVLSVMLEWLRCARRRSLVVESVRLSSPLSRVTAMAGLDRLLSQGMVEALD
ncbi:phospholipid transport system transporter-binding protein [Modicisalibacter ilicicola DSM 19980]|uniref:Phospholipid transport system transporter-binding protein n=1 Tax=Modicisalibacter ilicicola DSM 19980 TaxID=1121942 RepID=A0A1M5C7V4_9GAMM|nr:STAS domain-containing protein [Halomonas ilicicola]SHF50736.1 phospholipid transport system transporter-binding protein [Halomonas ilicicola DSM 19980]